MNKYALICLSACFLIACEKGPSPLETLQGRWEAAYLIYPGQDTFFYENDPGLCAYSVFSFEYNSGFELSEDLQGDLIWCGSNKEQYFNWSYDEGELSVIFNGQEYSHAIEELTPDSMIFRIDDGYYLMKKE